MRRILFLFLLFGLAFVVDWSGGTEIAKIIVFEVVTVLGLILVLNSAKMRITRYWWLLALGVHALLLGDLTGNPLRLQGTIVLLFVLLSSAIWADMEVRKIPKWIPVLALAGMLIGGYLVAPDATGRWVGTLGEANAFGAVGVFFWPFWAWWGLFPAVMLVILAHSRSAGLAILAQISFLGTKKLKWAFLILAVGLFLPMFDSQKSWENRWQIWQTAVHAGWQKPILGWGFGRTQIALSQSSIQLGNKIQYVTVDSAHNIFLDWWVQWGVFGLAILIYVLARSFTIYSKHKAYTEITLLIGLIGVMCFNPSSIVTLVQFWWLIGRALFGYPVVQRPNHHPQVVNRRQAVVK